MKVRLYKLAIKLRPIWAHRYFGIIGFWFCAYYLFLFIKDFKKPYFQERDRIWQSYFTCITISELKAWFRDEYKYHADAGGGAFDHDNSPFEAFIRFGDCDDAAMFAMRKLRKLGYKARRVYFIDAKDVKQNHVDCVFETKVGLGTVYNLWNYGKVLGAVSEDFLPELLYPDTHQNKIMI
jgi:hypothetical protein